ncbi:hypothetical protein A3J17_00550 [Candidatus Curtissbacteria bacterium RIFCSPLOWO2_02_FULL_40_11]|nr:MAG: hypothetical protein A3J17_00550 [Candidatus Curtissbacteria bacterium RIFCSPLOWO2_02_FULL_40_11]
MGSIEAETNREIEGERTFHLPLTQREVGVTIQSVKTHPVFPYHVRSGESHRIGNLLISAGDPCLETNSVELTVQDSHSGDHPICLNEVRLVDDILLLGSKGSAALREIKRDGIVMLQMSLSREIELNMTIPGNKDAIPE